MAFCFISISLTDSVVETDHSHMVHFTRKVGTQNFLNSQMGTQQKLSSQQRLLLVHEGGCLRRVRARVFEARTVSFLATSPHYILVQLSS